jgi:hypothetical protein
MLKMLKNFLTVCKYWKRILLGFGIRVGLVTLHVAIFGWCFSGFLIYFFYYM